MRLWPSPDVPLTCLGCDQAAKQWEKKIPIFSQGGLLENILTNRVRSISTAILKPPSHHSNVVFKIVSLLSHCLGTIQSMLGHKVPSRGHTMCLRCYGLNCIPPRPHHQIHTLMPQSSVPQNETVFESGVFIEVIRLK